MHYMKVNSLNHQIYDSVALALYQHKELRARTSNPITDCWDHYQVSYSKNKVHDNSNAFYKPYIDALVRSGIIVDDSCKFIHMSAVSTNVCMERDEVVITILELDC